MFGHYKYLVNINKKAQSMSRKHVVCSSYLFRTQLLSRTSDCAAEEEAWKEQK